MERLPPIHIRIQTDEREFLLTMAELAGLDGRFIVDSRFDAFGQPGFHGVNFRCKETAQHEGLGGQLIVFPDRPRYVAVEIRAKRWKPNDPPNYATYAQAARKIFRPLLHAYNAKTGRRKRLYIAPAEKLQPKLTRKCQWLFDRFVSCANKQMLHPLDWNRFYEFAAAFTRRDRMSGEDVTLLLEKEGFSQEQAEKLGSLFHHLRNFRSLF